MSQKRPDTLITKANRGLAVEDPELFAPQPITAGSDRARMTLTRKVMGCAS
jgi:hypothetical protein